MFNTRHSPSKTCPSYKSAAKLTAMLSIFRLQYMKATACCLWMNLPFMDHTKSQHAIVVPGWVFFCNEQSAVSVTCWGDQTSFIPRANKPHRLRCQKHHPFNRDKSERGQPAYCHTASTALHCRAPQTDRGRVNTAH